MTHPQPSLPSSVEADQDLLDRLLREAFKPSSPEFESYTHVRPTLPLSLLAPTRVSLEITQLTPALPRPAHL